MTCSGPEQQFRQFTDISRSGLRISNPHLRSVHAFEIWCQENLTSQTKYRPSQVGRIITFTSCNPTCLNNESGSVGNRTPLDFSNYFKYNALIKTSQSSFRIRPCTCLTTPLRALLEAFHLQRVTELPNSTNALSWQYYLPGAYPLVVQFDTPAMYTV